jgi:hypothetical protein
MNDSRLENMEYNLEFSHGSVHLNEEQFQVVTSPLTENQRILASAGSGKTTTITARIAYLIQEYEIDPASILLVTFSRAAAQEMIHRVHRLIGIVPSYAGTFHAISAQILREMSPSFVKDTHFIDELPYLLVKWLQTEAGKKWVKGFTTIIIDEFQDINEIQWQMISAFQHKHATITIVGDDAQNIYTWRGSSVNFILDFHHHVAHVKDYQLCRNYRSSEAIVTICNATMRFIPTLPFKEKMIAHARGGRKPEVHFFFRASDECDWIVNSLDKMLKQCETNGFTFAVLSRYNSDLFKMEERLHMKQIPYQLFTNPDENHAIPVKKRITLATIHASKGLEWDIVFFMNLHDDIFPSRKNDDDIICERRLFYVGITRAKKGLYMTYSRQERSLSRFVREIPRPFLQFHNVSSFKLSTCEFTGSTLSIEDMLRGFDGADWNELRDASHIPCVGLPQTETIYPFGELFVVPDWVRQQDVRETWIELLRWIALRECAIYQDKLEQLQTPEITETLLTLRIYREDIEFWEQYEAEMEHLIHKFLKHTVTMPPVEYIQLDTYVRHKLSHLEWSAQEMSHALIIIAKIRGQLRPLRHAGFDLNEFSFGVVHHSVPTELRPDIITSWHHVIDKRYKTHEILGDLWRIASIRSVNQGRNIPLYQYYAVLPFLNGAEQQHMTKMMERVIPLWVVNQDHPAYHFLFEAEGIRPMQFDILTETCGYFLYFDTHGQPSIEDKILLLLKHYAYEEIFEKTMESIGFINLATGCIMKYEITSTIRTQLNQLWIHLQTKYHLE